MAQRLESLPVDFVKLYMRKKLYISINRGQGQLDHCERLQDEYFLARLQLKKCLRNPNSPDQVIALALKLIDCYPDVPPELEKQDGIYLLYVRNLARMCDKDDLVVDKRVSKILGGNL